MPAAAAAQAVPRLDLKGFHSPAAGEARWVIQLPGVLPAGRDPAISSNPADWRVELIVGGERMAGCHGPRRNGRITRESVKGLATPLYRVREVAVGPCTRMGCPSERGPRRAFVALGSKPYGAPCNVSLPIVIDAPRTCRCAGGSGRPRDPPAGGAPALSRLQRTPSHLWLCRLRHQAGWLRT